MGYKVLDSLHRPFHRPLWIVKWVCYFIKLREEKNRGYLNYKDKTVDFYFSLLDWLYNAYPQDSDGLPSRMSVVEVWQFFSEIDKEKREEKLRTMLSKKRERGIETKIYSTYKAATYYLNLADDKLRFIGKNCEKPIWQKKQLNRLVLKSGITNADRKTYIHHILQNDAHFFLAMCLLQKFVMKYGLKMEEEIYKFMQRYYPVANFDYTQRSHTNYYIVRKRWVELLNAVNDKGKLSSVLMTCIKGDSDISSVYNNIELHVKDYNAELKKRHTFIEQKKKFLATYQKIVRSSEDKSGFVNLYDVSTIMRMNYDRFQLFLTQFYKEERLVRNIYFINIVSTIEQRRRFYIGKAPVIKIKITKNNEI